ARELHVPTVIIPLYPSNFSALGMLVADERHDYTRTYYADLQNVDFKQIEKIYAEMVEEAKKGLRRGEQPDFQVQFDLRYVGQEFTLSVPVSLAQIKAADKKVIRTAFDELYEH